MRADGGDAAVTDAAPGHDQQLESENRQLKAMIDALRVKLEEMQAAGVDADRLIFAVDAVGARSERALMTVNEDLDGELRVALLRFGKHTVDIAALAELRPEVCELEPAIVELAGTEQRARFDATCAVAHELGARTQASGVPADGHLRGIDQIRAPLGERLQKLAPLSIGR